nr:uncharacterized protein CI109_003761 [Kwoniella shandongensis]KAA5527790.1 hypothetical protein CI109_003761 [Kwoniella shandongensis]
MAPFRPPPSSTQLQDILHQSSPRAASSESGDTKSQDAFETTSTSPAGSSLQDVSESTRKLPTSGTKVVEPVPAMKDVVTSSSSVPQDEGRRKKEMIVMGVAIPPKPVPPGEEECCMSGCINCVYTIYSSELEEYTEAITAAQSALEKGDVPFSEWPEELKKGKGEDVRQREEEKKEVGMDASMSAFLA